MDANKDGVMEEVEALQSIFMDELNLVRDRRDRLKELNITLHPATAQNEAEQYVCATLHIELSPDYPSTSPQLALKNPRGLSDETLCRLHHACNRKAREYQGLPVLYELIELVRDGLTSCNIPSGECCICLLGFTEQDVFTRTSCYHHFHSRCLGNYVSATRRQFLEEEKRDKIEQPNRVDRPKRQVVCPICREAINYDVEALLNAPAPMHGDELASFNPSPDLRAVQEKMSRLFVKQQEKGGHVDPEKSDRLVITKQSASVCTDIEKGTENAEAVKQDEVATSSAEVNASKCALTRNEAMKREDNAADSTEYERYYHQGKRNRGGRRGWQPRYQGRGWDHRHYEDGFYRDEQPRYRGRSRGRRYGASRDICDSERNEVESERRNEDGQRRQRGSSEFMKLERRRGQYRSQNDYKENEGESGRQNQYTGKEDRQDETGRWNHFAENGGKQRRHGRSGRRNDYAKNEDRQRQNQYTENDDRQEEPGRWNEFKQDEDRPRRHGRSGRRNEYTKNEGRQRYHNAYTENEDQQRNQNEVNEDRRHGWSGSRDEYAKNEGRQRYHGKHNAYKENEDQQRNQNEVNEDKRQGWSGSRNQYTKNEGRQRYHGKHNAYTENEDQQRNLNEVNEDRRHGWSGSRNNYTENQNRQLESRRHEEDGQVLQRDFEDKNKAAKSEGQRSHTQAGRQALRKPDENDHRGRRSYGTRYYRRSGNKDHSGKKELTRSTETVSRKVEENVAPPPGFQFTAPPPGFAVRPQFSMPSSSS